MAGLLKLAPFQKESRKEVCKPLPHKYNAYYLVHKGRLFVHKLVQFKGAKLSHCQQKAWCIRQQKARCISAESMVHSPAESTMHYSRKHGAFASRKHGAFQQIAWCIRLQKARCIRQQKARCISADSISVVNGVNQKWHRKLRCLNGVYVT